MNPEIAIDQQSGPSDTPCPRCGVDARCDFVDQSQTQMEIVCPDCGRFAMPIAEFHQAVNETVEVEEGE